MLNFMHVAHSIKKYDIPVFYTDRIVSLTGGFDIPDFESHFVHILKQFWCNV